MPASDTKTFRVIKTIRKRGAPSFYAAHNPADPDAPVGLVFKSKKSVFVTESIPPGGPAYSVTWEQLPDDNMWVPRNHYKTKEIYLIENVVEFITKITVEMSDGSVWSATQFKQEK